MLLTLVVIFAQITLPLGALLAVVQPTPQMAQAVTQQVGLGDWIATAAGKVAAWAQPLWGQPQTASAQTAAPGGVTSGLRLWVKATAGTNTTTPGANVTAWNDQSGNGANMTVTAAGREPTYQTGAAASNYNPTIRFDGTNDGMELAPFMTGVEAGGAVFGAASNNTPGTGFDNLVVFGIDNPHLGTATGTGAPLGYMNGSSPIRADHPATPVAGQFHLWNWEWTMSPNPYNIFSNTGMDVIFNGEPFSEPTMEVTESFFAEGAPAANQFQIGSYEAVEVWDGNISEVIVYDRNLTAAESQRVSSYMSIKYGTTLDANPASATVNYDYLAADGTTVIWSGTGNATYQPYHNNVAGIGRDDDSALDQRKSNSVNAGFQPVIDNGAAFSANKSFLVWGSNNSATSYGVSYTPTGFSPPGGYFRMARVWKVQETGTVGNVSVQGSGADHLLVSSDPTFATGVTELDLSSGSATVNFSNGQFFTFGANVTAPGGTSANLALWLKANAGTSSTTDGTAINLWADQTLLGNDAAQATGSLQPEYMANSGLFNFNPSVDFNPSARLQADISATAAWGSNDGTVYVIYNQETGTLTWRNLVDFGTSALDSNNPQFGMTPSNVIGSWDDNGSAQTDSTFVVVNGETRMAGYDFDNNVLGGQKFHFDGRVANAGALKKIGPTIGNFLNIGGDPQLGEYMLGQIAEVVVYQTQHDAATRQKVQSYLALKYGITLDITDNDGTIVEGDYVTTGGAKAWDKTANSSYHNDVAGIGRDDAEALYQKQSKSLATDDIITMGIGPVTTSNVANTGVFTSNLSYLVWGNNNASATTTTALNVATCAAPGQSDQRINRVWKVQETGALGKVYVQAALSAGFNANLGVYMMVSTDPTFATYTSVPMTKNGAVYDTSYNFTSGDYFTFAGNTTAPANLCTDGNKYINWWNVGWGYGVKTKTVTQGSQTFTFSFTDASNVLFAPIFYPHQFWNRLYVPRYDNNPTAAVQFKMTMSKPALSVQFEVCDVDGWFGGKDVTTFSGFLGGSPVGNPKLSKAKSIFSGWGLTLPAANKAQGNNFWWDCWNPGRVFVDFNQPVDEIRIDYTKNNQYSFKQFNDIQIGSINVQCAAPPPPPTPDNIYVSKRAPQGSNLVNEPFTFAFELENLSCQNKTTTFADTLPAGLTYIGESLITPLSGTENVYSGTQSLALTNLIVPPGKSTLNIDARGSAAGTYNNQASITVGGNSYLSDDPNQVGSANTTPVTLIASPFPVANLAVSKSASVATIGQNKTFTYTVQLTNNQATPVTVHFHDVLDGQMTYVAGSLVNPNGGTVQAYAGESVLDVYTMTLPVGLSTLHIQVNTNSTPFTNTVNVAEVTPQLGSGFLSDRIQSNAVNVLITNAVPNLTIGKSGPATATQGSNFNYTLVVTNTGTAATSGVITVADTLPAGLSFVSGSGGGFTCTAAGQNVTCTSSAVIAMNGTATITLAVNPTATGAKNNTASVIGGGDSSAASSNTVNTTVDAAPTATPTVTPTATETSTATPTATPTSTNTEAPTATPTATTVAATATPTATPTNTTVPPTATATATPTSTSAPPTATPTVTPTSTTIVNGGIEYKVVYNAALNRYEIWMRSSVTPGAPKTTGTAQVTVKVPHVVGSGIFTSTNITAQVAGTGWAIDSRTNGPAADTNADYLSFSLDFPTGNHAAINWQAGQEILMFTFQNGGVCAGAVSLMENSDPFNVAPNNPGQQIDVLALGSDPGNDFLGNYNLGQADCDRDGDGVVNGSDLDDDGDGLLDSVEGALTVDTDSDGIPDALDLDSDGDGLPDNIEAQTTAGYVPPSSSDGDGDGLDNAYEGAGNAGLTPVNTDGADTPDYKDADSDNAQGNDTSEAGLTKSNADADKDGLDDGIDSNDSAFGPVNAGITTPATTYPNTNSSGDVDYRDSSAVLSYVTLPVKVILNGAYNSGVGLMRDDLRSKGLLPVTSPYTQAVASAQASVFSITGTQAIVDWVLVEVRNSATPTTVVVRQAALLQRDGDVVAINGSSTLTATLAAGNYYVSIRHRNHLGVMTGAPVALSTSSALIDFTMMSATYGANAQRLANGLYQLWAGDTNGNGQVIGAGPGNELNPILGDVLTAPGNAEHNRNYIVVGYSNGDVNLDGQVIAAGPGNDINSIYNGVFLHPANASIAANYIVQERLP
jgi:uncharacterized repeat protein (TIGR01451 family)